MKELKPMSLTPSWEDVVRICILTLELGKDGEAKEFAMKEMARNVQRRAGDKTRCTANWCGVNEWCDQYQLALDYERGSG